MSLGDSPETVQALNNIWHHTSRATVLLYGEQNADVVHAGSGVLLRIGDAYFILTVAHVAKAMFYGIPMFVASATGRVVPLKEVQVAYCGSEGAHDETLDVAAIKIPKDVAESQLPARRFLSCAEIDVSRERHEAPYLILGYPEANTLVGDRPLDRNSAILGYVGALFDREPLPAEYSADAHVLLSYSVDDSVGMAEQPRAVPHPRGMSGCGVWRLDVLRSDACLVAIQSKFDRRRQYVKGVWVLHALRLIWQYFPQVRPALVMHFGKLGRSD